jgi:hypothetical protein
MLECRPPVGALTKNVPVKDAPTRGRHSARIALLPYKYSFC